MGDLLQSARENFSTKILVPFRGNGAVDFDNSVSGNAGTGEELKGKLKKSETAEDTEYAKYSRGCRKRGFLGVLPAQAQLRTTRNDKFQGLGGSAEAEPFQNVAFNVFRNLLENSLPSSSTGQAQQQKSLVSLCALCG
jgi:hypothetical protein